MHYLPEISEEEILMLLLPSPLTAQWIWCSGKEASRKSGSFFLIFSSSVSKLLLGLMLDSREEYMEIQFLSLYQHLSLALFQSSFKLCIKADSKIIIKHLLPLCLIIILCSKNYQIPFTLLKIPNK